MKRMAFLWLLLLISCVVPIGSVAAQVEELWVARYDGPGGGEDTASALAVDGAGNVYVTGASGGDYATIKYDANGKALWVARYDGPEGRDDSPTALAVDVAGNVYVTGASGGSFATIKYDSEGNELWVVRYGRVGGRYDGARALAVDGAGNVYVTGKAAGSGTGSYVTVKYDSEGNELWVARYDGPAPSWETVQALVVDGAGNVYVTGQSAASGRQYDYATVKYDSEGNELWVARYNGPGDRSDRALALAVDRAGNVYVTGQSTGTGTGASDYATVKYDSEGNELWVARYDGASGGQEWASALAVDGAGNVYVTGESTTVKYDSDGNELWVARGGRALAVDGAGNVYVTGASGGVATIKYDSEGNELWVARYQGPAGGGDGARAVAVDEVGNVYVAGTSLGSGTGLDYATVKYSQGPGEFVRGDCNDDGDVNVADATCTINWLFAAVPEPACVAALNANADERVDIADPVSLLNFLFGGGPAPVAPFPDCGPDPTPDDLSCQSFAGCE